MVVPRLRGSHLDVLSPTRSDGTGAAATVQCRCSRSRLRGSAACNRDSVLLSARKRARVGIESGPTLRRRHGTTSRTNASDHGALFGQARVSWHTVSPHARLPFCYAITPVFTCPTDTSEQSSGRNSGCSHPKIDGTFDPFGHRDGSNVPAFTY